MPVKKTEDTDVTRLGSRILQLEERVKFLEENEQIHAQKHEHLNNLVQSLLSNLENLKMTLRKVFSTFPSPTGRFFNEWYDNDK